MEKDHNFSFPAKHGSPASSDPRGALPKQHISSCISLNTSCDYITASDCPDDAVNAVADSKKTKAVIASRRNDFFSDLMAPLTTVLTSGASALSTALSTATTVTVSSYSTHKVPLTVTSIPVVNLSIPSTTVNVLLNSVNVTLTSVNVHSNAVNNPSMTVPLTDVSHPSTAVNVPSITMNVPSNTATVPFTAANAPPSCANNPSTTVDVPSITVNVPSATINVPSITANVSSTTVTDNFSSTNAKVFSSSTSTAFPGPGISVPNFTSSYEIDNSADSSHPSTGFAVSLNHVNSHTVSVGGRSKTSAITAPKNQPVSVEPCQLSDFVKKHDYVIPCISSLKLNSEESASETYDRDTLCAQALKRDSDQVESVKGKRAILTATDSKVDFEKPDCSKTDDVFVITTNSDLGCEKADGLKTDIDISHITGLNQGQRACPPVEFVRAPVQVVEPICFEATPCSSIHLEPSPERIWGPQVSFLTFSCLDISRTEVVGQMRQVSSTGCLEVIGSGHRPDDTSEASKLNPSNGEFSSTHSISDSPRNTKPNRSPVDEMKSVSVSNSFQDFDWSRSAPDASFRSKKSGTTSGWSVVFHSPSTRRKREPSVERDTIPMTKVKETWKGKMARTFRRVGSASVLSPNDHAVSARAKGTFDVPIELCVLSAKTENLPLIVEMCTRVIEERGIENQGIYRVPGNNGFVRQMVEDLNEDPSGLCADNERWHDVNVVSSLLKLFFRRLPDPLVTYKLYQPVIDASRILDIDARLLRLRDVLHDLPPVNFRTFHFLAKHLHRVAEHEKVNKMEAHNLAIIFGPTLIRPPDGNMVAVINDMNDQCRVVELVILHHDWFFGISEEELEIPRSEDSKESTPVSSMSEELLARAQQLGDFESPSCGATDRMATIELGQKEKFRWGRDPKHSDDSAVVMTDTPTVAAAEERQGSIREIVFEIRRYPAYHFCDSSMFCTENAKPKVRKTHSSESLNRRTDTPAFAERPSSSDAKRSAIPFNASCGQLTE